MQCDVRQYSDLTVCERCGLRWDTNDADPPKCGDAATSTDPHAIVVSICNDWLAAFAHRPITQTPAHEYAASAVADVRDALLARLASSAAKAPRP